MVLSLRNFLLFLGVLLVHAAALWGMQKGLLARSAEMVVPVALISEFIEAPTVKSAPLPVAAPPAPVIAPPKPVPRPEPVKKKAVVKKRPAPPPQPMPVAAAEVEPDPAEDAPVGVVQEPPAPENAEVGDEDQLASAGAAPDEAGGGGGVVGQGDGSGDVLPSSGAGHLHNPRPVYPPVSQKMREEGVVLLEVLVSADGRPKTVKVIKGSGYRRLDEVARTTVLQRWRFVPGKRNGVPVEMSVQQAIRFEIK